MLTRLLGVGSALLVLSAVLVPTSSAACCPFCSGQGQTLTKEVNTASFVVLGSLSNARLSSNVDDIGGGTTDLTIEEVVKAHPFLKDKKQIVLPKYVPVDPERPIKFLVFCDFFRDKIDPYRGIPSKDKDLAIYLKGAVELDEKNTPKRLAFFFGYLDHADLEISTDAYKEFANADYADVIKMVEGGDKKAFREKLIKWLRDANTPAYRYGLYGYLLGCVGGQEDVQIYHELIDPKRGVASGLDGLLAGYVSLQPKEGWEYVRKTLSDPSADFNRRYSALRTARFFWEYRPDLIKHGQVVEAVALLLDQGDIADLAIEDLRKWKQVQLADKILGLYGRESHNVPIIHRAILRFALNCPPENKKAADFVAAQRKLDPDRVKDVEELLRLEVPPPKPPEGSGKR
jgi:hypothetical protein